jgi:cytochrome c6
MAWLERVLGQRGWPLQAAAIRRWVMGPLVGTALVLWALLTAVAPAAAADRPASQQARLQAGAQLFEAHCVGCHLNGGNVIRRGRTLKLGALEKAGLADPAAIARIAAGGIGQMSGYGAVLGEEGAAEVGEWVWLQARAGWPRPAQMEPLP